MQKIKGYKRLLGTLKKYIRKLTLKKVKTSNEFIGGANAKSFEFYAIPKGYRKTYGFYCLWDLNEQGFLFLDFGYRGKKKWYDILKRLIPSKRRELKYNIATGISVPAGLAPQKKCKEYNALSKPLEADVNSQLNTVHLILNRYVSNKQELEETIKTALSTLRDEETKKFIKNLGV